jgi:hypothetical protein
VHNRYARNLNAAAMCESAHQVSQDPSNGRVIASAPALRLQRLSIHI